MNRTHEERTSQQRTRSIPLARPTATAPHVALAKLQRQAGNRAVARLVASVQRQPPIQKAPTDWTKPQTNVRGSGITRHEVHGLTFGQSEDFFLGEKSKTKTPASHMAVVLVPDSYNYNPKNPIQVILHFHGFGFRPGDPYAGYRPRKDDTVRDIALDHLEQQIGAVTGGTQVVAILAQGIGKSQFGKIPTFAYVRDVLGKTTDGKGRKIFGNVPPFSVVLSAHSGGGSTVRDKLKAGEAETADRSRLSTAPRGKQKGVDDSLAPVDLIVLFEALNGKSDVGAVETWVERQLQRLKPELAKTPAEAATALAATPKLRGYFGSRASDYKKRYTTLHGEIKNKIGTHIPDAWHVKVHDLFRIIEVVNPVEREFQDKDKKGKSTLVRDKRVGHEEVISGGVVEDDRTGIKTQKEEDAEKQGAMGAALLASVDASSDRAQALSCDKCTAKSPAPSKVQNAPAQAPARATTPRGAGAAADDRSVPPVPAPVQRKEDQPQPGPIPIQSAINLPVQRGIADVVRKGVGALGGGLGGAIGEAVRGGNIIEGAVRGAAAGIADAARAGVAITFGPHAVESTISQHSLDIVKDILVAAGLSSATITSTARTAEDQARAMFDNLQIHGVAHQKALYGPAGDEVIDVYAASKRASKNAIQIRADMVAKITAIGPARVSRHCAADHTRLNVFDVSPRSIGDADANRAFKRAAQAEVGNRVSNFIPYPKDPGHHFEITPH